MAIEIVDFPIKNGDFHWFSIAMVERAFWGPPQPYGNMVRSGPFRGSRFMARSTTKGR